MERLRERIARDGIEHDGHRLEPVTLSAGVATWPDTTEGLDELLVRADQALYRAKAAGRNRVELAR